jgi:peptidyl-prolyl cis-trans isomerase C
VRKLVAAGASFEALAMEKSRDPATRFNGGDLGYFTTDVMPEGYEAALKDARVGQVIGPIPVAGGYALVKIEDVREEQPAPLEAARPQIVRFLTYDRIRDLLEKLRAKAKVETLIKPEAGAAKPVPPADAPKAAPTPPPPAAPATHPAPAPRPASARPKHPRPAPAAAPVLTIPPPKGA